MLKPQNIVQAAEADLARRNHNAREAELADPSYEPYAFHRLHVRRAGDARELLILALMDSGMAAKTAKSNTRLIYGDAGLLLSAIRESAP
jgi:hypothetical protein